MTSSLLTAFWIVPPSPHGPLGFGVTAWSLDDAIRIIRSLGYAGYLPDDLSTLSVREGVTVADLDHHNIS